MAVKNKMLLISLLLISLLCLSSCGQSFPVSIDVNTDVQWQLWKLADEDSAVYMMGSVHFADPSIYPPDKFVLDAFESADYLAVEYNLDAISEDDTIKVFEAVTYTDGTTLRDHLDADVYDYVNTVCPLSDKADTYTISYISTSLMTELLSKVQNITHDAGVDSYFTDLALQENKEIVNIESFDTQLKLLAGLGDDGYESAKLLSTAIMFTKPAELKRSLQNTVNMWATCDTEAAAEAMLDITAVPDAFKPYAEAEIELTLSRNKQMAEKAIEFLNTSDNYFFVVGLGHYGGENGILSILKNKGYEVTVVTDES